MHKDKQTIGFYEFASFRLDVKQCRLTSGDATISLTPKEFDLLLFLIENSNRVVGKDELLEAIWQDTFVEEATLTRNVSWLRKKLAAHAGDDFKIIETLPKRGYRFLPELKNDTENLQLTEDQSILHFDEQTIQRIEIEEIIEFEPTEVERGFAGAKPSETIKVLPPMPTKNRFSLPLILFFGLIFVFFAAFAYREFISSNRSNVFLAAKITPFSGLPGRENSPAFSPDGKQIIFAWDGGVESGNSDIYLKLIGAGNPVRLTDTQTEEINPVFSPDGKSIAFVRLFPTHNEIILMPALGGAERKIYEKASYASLSFSPDGKNLAFAELDSSENQAGIYSINLETGEKIKLTTPENPVVDHTPRFSPDGKFLAFIRYFSSFHREIFVVPATGGEARQITADDARIYGITWNADSRSLFFTSFRANDQLNLWQISTDGDGTARIIPTGSKNLQDLAMSPDGKTIAFVDETADENIWEIASGQSPRLLIRSTRADHSQQFSPDGTQIVFASDRTGNYEIWLADADGKNQWQLTDTKESAGSPRFSPDGKFVAFDAQTAGSSAVYVVSINGGAARQLTLDNNKNALPAWSVDGNSIFFVSNRSGSDQIWKMPASGGDAVKITEHGAFEMFAAPNGKQIIYSKGGGKSGLWTVGINGGDEKPLPALDKAGAWRSWTVTASGVYFTATAVQIPLQINFYDFATGQTRQIAAVEKAPLAYYANLTVSNDDKRILYARQDQTGASIMLAELPE